MSTMPSPLNVLVIGYGLLGGNVLRVLSAPPISDQVRVHLLVKPASLADATKRAAIDAFVAKGVALVEGNVADGADALAALFTAHAIHTVVNAANPYSTWPPSEVDRPVLAACKAAASVRHLIPSDYGFWADDMDSSNAMWEMRYREKAALHAAIRESGLDWTFFAVGGFSELLFKMPTFGVELATRTIKAPTSFDIPVTYTSIRDIGQLVAQAVVDPAARNQLLRTGEQYTHEQVAAALEHATGDEVTRVVVSEAEARAALADNPMHFQSMFVLEFMAGKGTHWPVEHTYCYPSFKYTTLQTVAERVVRGEM